MAWYDNILGLEPTPFEKASDPNRPETQEMMKNADIPLSDPSDVYSDPHTAQSGEFDEWQQQQKELQGLSKDMLDYKANLDIKTSKELARFSTDEKIRMMDRMFDKYTELGYNPLQILSAGGIGQGSINFGQATSGSSAISGASAYQRDTQREISKQVRIGEMILQAFGIGLNAYIMYKTLGLKGAGLSVSQGFLENAINQTSQNDRHFNDSLRIRQGFLDNDTHRTYTPKKYNVGTGDHKQFKKRNKKFFDNYNDIDDFNF